MNSRDECSCDLSEEPAVSLVRHIVQNSLPGQIINTYQMTCTTERPSLADFFSKARDVVDRILRKEKNLIHPCKNEVSTIPSNPSNISPISHQTPDKKLKYKPFKNCKFCKSSKHRHSMCDVYTTVADRRSRAALHHGEGVCAKCLCVHKGSQTCIPCQERT